MKQTLAEQEAQMRRTERELDLAVFAGDWEAAAKILDELGRTADAKHIRSSFSYAQQQLQRAWSDLKAALLDVPLVRRAFRDRESRNDRASRDVAK